MKRTHGASGTQEYRVWYTMRNRCRNPKVKSYADYGARGVDVCDKWYNDFAAFAADVGKRPTPQHTLDRIDNDKNYEPGNVRWRTRLEQAQNTRQVKLVSILGLQVSHAVACRMLGLRQPDIFKRRAAWRCSSQEVVNRRLIELHAI